MFKIRILQVSYFLTSAIEIIFEAIGFIFEYIAQPFDDLSYKILKKMIKLAKELNEIKENN